MTNTAMTAAGVCTSTLVAVTVRLCPSCKTAPLTGKQKTCSLKCRVAQCRETPEAKAKAAAITAAKKARKKSQAAQLLRVENHGKAIRRSVKLTHSSGFGHKIETVEGVNEKNKVNRILHFGGEIPPGMSPCPVKENGKHIVYGAVADSIQTIPLHEFIEDENLREKEAAKHASRLAKKQAAARQLEENLRNGVASEVGEDTHPLVDVTAVKTVAVTKSVIEAQHETELLPTTGREVPPYLKNSNENVTTVIPTVKIRKPRQIVKAALKRAEF